MVKALHKKNSKIYYPRFGQIALDKGFITIEHLNEALTEQTENNPAARLRPHKLVGEIFFEKGLMDSKQIELILSELSLTEISKKTV
jgi:hypothetical protein